MGGYCPVGGTQIDQSDGDTKLKFHDFAKVYLPGLKKGCYEFSQLIVR